MAEKERTSTTLKKIANMAAFVGLVLVAVAIILTTVLGWFGVSASVIGVFRMIGECIAYAITAFYAFFYIRGKRNPAWAIVYAICATIVVVLIILR